MDNLNAEGSGSAKTVKRAPQHQHNPHFANYWAPLPWQRHHKEHRPQPPSERNDLTQHAKGKNVQGPVTKPQPDRMSHRGGGGGMCSAWHPGSSPRRDMPRIRLAPCTSQDVGVCAHFAMDHHTLLRFLIRLQAMYHRVPFHNFYLAADTAHSMSLLVKALEGTDVLTPLDKLVLLTAAVLSFVGHPGLNNSRQYTVSGPSQPPLRCARAPPPPRPPACYVHGLPPPRQLRPTCHQAAGNYAQDRLGYVGQQKQVAKTTHPSTPTPTRSPLEPGPPSSRGRRGQGATNPLPLPLPRPLHNPLPTATRSPATQCPPGQKE